MANDSKAMMAMLEARAKLAEAKLAEAEAKLAAAPVQRITVKVGPKGTVCVYGLGRNPVSLYPSQWTALRNDHEALATVDKLVQLSKSDPAAFAARAKEAADRAAERATERR